MINNETTIIIDFKKIMRALVIFAAILVFLHICCKIFVALTGHDYVYGIIPLFLLENEANVPTFFSAILLFLSSGLLGLIAIFKHKAQDVFKKQWAFLSFIFLWLSFDEAAGFHDLLTRPMAALVGSSGLLHFTWIIPGIVFVIIVCLLYFKFWLWLPRITKRLFFIAAICYVGGAVGLESIGGYIKDVSSKQNIFHTIEVVLEESLEMGGVLIFIYALFGYMQSNYQKINVMLRK